MHALVKAHPLTTIEAGEPVFDGLEMLDDLAFDTGLLLRFTNGRYLRLLARINQSFGQLPSVLSLLFQ